MRNQGNRGNKGLLVDTARRTSPNLGEVFSELLIWMRNLADFLVSLAGEVSNQVKIGIKDASQGFSDQLTKLSTVISTQGVSQVVSVFEGEPNQFRDWIKSIEKYILLAGGDENQSKRLAYQTSRGAVSDYIHRYMTENPGSTWEELKSELSVRFAEVSDPHHAFTMLRKARQLKHETVQVYAERLHTLAHDAFHKIR